MTSIAELPHILMTYVLPFIGMLVIIVFVHEYGHFKVARMCGVTVETFSIGFGKELWHGYDRHGTRWRVALLPLGGYVKFLGDADAASAPDGDAMRRLTPEQRGRTLQGASLKHRTAIVAAGPLANFALAIVLFAGNAYFNGTRAIGTIAGELVPGGAAEAAGLRPGDRIVAIDGVEIRHFSELQKEIAARPGVQTALSYEREGRVLIASVTPRTRTVPGLFSSQEAGFVGIRPAATEANVVRTEYGAPAAAAYGFTITGTLIRDNVKGFLMLVLGRGSFDDLAGPITLAQLSGDSLRDGLATFIRFIAVISVAIGFVNLLPVPMLDGGHLMFYALEGIRGRPLSERAQEFSFRIGFAVVMSLMALGLVSDFLRKFGA